MRRRAFVALATVLALAVVSMAMPTLAELQRMIARFAAAELRVDTSGLAPGDAKALAKLIEAARVLNDIFLQQMWSGNVDLHARLQKDDSALGRARLLYFWINKSPWSEIDQHTAFVPDVPPKKLVGANFYPEDMTRDEFEAWVKTLAPDQRRQAEGFFTVIHRDPATRQLRAVPYSQEYAKDLERAAALLRDAAALTGNESLKEFLNLRADAFLSNDYYASDLAWMDLDAPIDVTIGPYETYQDELFGYKAAFEAYVSLRDEKESEQVKFFAGHLQEIENNLPIDPQYRNPKIGELAPIRVVNEVFSSGDGAHGIQTAAYNLPNDERVVAERGSKRIMLKNVQEAKFRQTLVPISRRVLPRSAQTDLNFDSFFTHILAHELGHGIGPQKIKAGGRDTTPRQEIKELYGTIEEAKADVLGLFMLQHLFDQKAVGAAAEPKKLYTTFLASSFRTLRFGLQDAHARGMAIQFNYLTDKGAFVRESGGTYAVDLAKIKGAVRDLAHDLLTIEATGDYAGAKKLLAEMGMVRPETQKALAQLNTVPTDIEPIYVTASAVTRAAKAPPPRAKSAKKKSSRR